ncbi:MAG: sce7726 family protein, partial [Lachnospiraceae bacterium]|nr:sce7726 family protein [Lachnospiraceae bacterium]
MDEKKLKLRLIDYILGAKYPKCKLIGVEVPFVSMKRRVDVLVITGNKELIAFEIKSDLDSLRRLHGQMKDYKKTFDKLYIVTSAKYKDICDEDSNRTSVGYIYINGKVDERKRAKSIKKLDKECLARFLLKADLINLGYDKHNTVEHIRKQLIRDTKSTEIL